MNRVSLGSWLIVEDKLLRLIYPLGELGDDQRRSLEVGRLETGMKGLLDYEILDLSIQEAIDRGSVRKQLFHLTNLLA